MAWIDTSERLPPAGHVANCKLRHCSTKGVIEHKLVRVEESDCNWRLADGNDEVSYDWDVIQWEDPGI